MQPSLGKKICTRIWNTIVGAQKIDGKKLKTYEMIIPLFQVDNKNGKSYFFKQAFLLVEISIDVAFRTFFFILSKVKVNLNNQELWWRLYTAVEALFTTQQMKFVGKKEFVVPALDLEDLTYVVYIMSLAFSDTIKIYPSRKAQIASFIVDKTPTTVPLRNSNLVDVFLWNCQQSFQSTQGSKIIQQIWLMGSSYPINEFIAQGWQSWRPRKLTFKSI